MSRHILHSGKITHKTRNVALPIAHCHAHAYTQRNSSPRASCTFVFSLVCPEELTWREALIRMRQMGLGPGQVLGRKGHMPMAQRQQGLHYDELVQGLAGKKRWVRVLGGSGVARFSRCPRRPLGCALCTAAHERVIGYWRSTTGPRRVRGLLQESMSRVGSFVESTLNSFAAYRCCLPAGLLLFSLAFIFIFLFCILFVLFRCPYTYEYYASLVHTRNERLLCSPFLACHTPGFQVNHNPEGEPGIYIYIICIYAPLHIYAPTSGASPRQASARLRLRACP